MKARENIEGMLRFVILRVLWLFYLWMFSELEWKYRLEQYSLPFNRLFIRNPGRAANMIHVHPRYLSICRTHGHTWAYWKHRWLLTEHRSADFYNQELKSDITRAKSLNRGTININRFLSPHRQTGTECRVNALPRASCSAKFDNLTVDWTVYPSRSKYGHFGFSWSLVETTQRRI